MNVWWFATISNIVVGVVVIAATILTKSPICLLGLFFFHFNKKDEIKNNRNESDQEDPHEINDHDFREHMEM